MPEQLAFDQFNLEFQFQDINHSIDPASQETGSHTFTGPPGNEAWFITYAGFQAAGLDSDITESKGFLLIRNRADLGLRATMPIFPATLRDTVANSVSISGGLIVGAEVPPGHDIQIVSNFTNTDAANTVVLSTRYFIGFIRKRLVVGSVIVESSRVRNLSR